MSHIEIINRFEQDGHFIVEAEHYHEDGSIWYSEHYRFGGKQGHTHKRATNASGEILLDDGTVAPTQVIEGDEVAYLPPGRDWARRPEPHMDDSTIWSAILSDHEQRVAAGYAGGRNVLSRQNVENEAYLHAGCEVLMERFDDTIGDVVVL